MNFLQHILRLGIKTTFGKRPTKMLLLTSNLCNNLSLLKTFWNNHSWDGLELYVTTCHLTIKKREESRIKIFLKKDSKMLYKNLKSWGGFWKTSECNR